MTQACGQVDSEQGFEVRADKVQVKRNACTSDTAFHPNWFSRILSRVAVRKTATRIHVALTVKREQVASKIGWSERIEPTQPLTDLREITEHCGRIKRAAYEALRKRSWMIGERRDIVSLKNSFKSQEHSATNKFRRYCNDTAVIHMSRDNLLVVVRDGERRRGLSDLRAFR